ncbi:pentatricopeptide repeat-containing protein [Prunus yedoensis var. nudiflora]|uniref:Pentatricopeptide repeat-containing protein n=1 Tax=Prunus yedoensis var. nudiflora TaxID=2094558 RepID=A0A314ZIQ5_PRUYE|nr:pentatricopeptide repeat-containing protein [Prunus yedoensis var. nudiflora]
MKRQRNEHDEVTVTLRTLDMFCKQLQLHLSHNMDEVTVTLAVKACPGLSRGPQTRMPNSRVCCFFWVCFVYYGFKFFDEYVGR